MSNVAKDLATYAKILEIKGGKICCIFVDTEQRPDLYGSIFYLKREDIILTKPPRVGDLLSVTFDRHQSPQGVPVYKPVFCET